MTTITSTALQTSMASDTATSVRYQSLLRGIEKVLSESRSKLDLADAVEQAYGQEASVLGGREMLSQVLEGMLDRVSETVTENMTTYCREHHVEEDLLHIERICSRFEAFSQAEAKQNEMDSQAAKDSLQQAQLPDGVKPMDIVQHRAYELMRQEEDHLQRMLADLTEETEQLEALLQSKKITINQEIEKVEEVGRELDRTADVCSSMS